MKRLKSFFKNRKAVLALISICVIFTAVLCLTLKQQDKTSPEDRNIFDGFSKLLINPANADDNFKLQPSASDSIGAEANSFYILESKEPIDFELIKKYLKIEPEFDFELKKVLDTEWHIIPKDSIKPNTLVKIAIAASYVDEQGEQKARDYSWVYQIKDSFKILHSIPRDAGASVPTNTGIEITFSHNNFIDFEKYFEITPKVSGRFEKHGRTMAFIPTNTLKKGSLYFVKIKKGLPLINSEETLLEDYLFTFETEQDQSQSPHRRWLTIYQKFYEVSSTKAPIIQVSARNVPRNEVAVAIYEFANSQDYMDALSQRDHLPWWSYSKEDFMQDVSALKFISEFKQTIKKNNNIQYVEFPESLPRGFYLAEFASGENKNQVWLQVSDLAAYINATKTDTIIWINNTRTKSPAENIDIEITDTDYQYSTDKKGIAKFATPVEITSANTDKKKTKRHYFKISKGDDILIMPASQISRLYWWHTPSKADDYWQYLYTDRPRYQTTDAIKYWGMLKKRDNKKISDQITITLYKEGYVDYYYRPVRIIEQKIELSEMDTFSGEMELKNVRPDYYTLELKINDDIIKRKYISIKPYIKPAYELSLILDRKAAFSDEVINLKAKASFFEGTPVPNLKLIFKTPEGEQKIITNELGEADLAYAKKYTDCNKNYGCWPKYASLSIRPENSELGEITANTSVRFYGPKIYLQSKTTYPEKGIAEINMTTKFLDLNAITESSWWRKGSGEKVAPSTKIEGQVIKTTYTKRETGTYYDFINKKTYKKYSYDKKEETVDNFSVVSGSNGNYTYRRAVEPETSYSVRLKVYDNQGRYDKYNIYLYYYNGRSFYRYSNWNYSYYHFKLDENKKSYSIGDNVLAKFMNNEEPMPDKENGYLFIQTQNGLQEYFVDNDSEYNFTFENRDIPNVNLAGVYFDGLSYIVAETGYYGRTVEFDKNERALKINIETDKEKYKPGEEVELTLSVTDINDKPKQTEVNLNLVDEAFYAVAEDSAKPLETIYNRVGSGSLYSKKSHYSVSEQFSGAEKGGCFAEGTMILMADGSEKPIEKIKTGNRVKTFSHPISRKLGEGEVIEVWKHIVGEYLIINSELKVTPEHQVYSNNHFTDIGRLKVGDWLLNHSGEKVFINSIEIKREVIPVYNLHIEPQNTYFANGFYVHNQEKGGGPREFFTDAALFKSIRTNKLGRASVKFTLPDNITSWRITAQAISKNIFAGANTAKIPVSLPVFEEVTIGKEYLSEDKPIVRIRAFGTALEKNDKVIFSIKAPSLGIIQSDPIQSTAFKSAFFTLPNLTIGKHNIIYKLATSKGNDSIKLPIDVIQSRLQAQFAKSEKLTTGTKIVAENNLPMAIVLSDYGQNQLYGPLQTLSWSWGDRVDQKLSRKQARVILKDAYNEEIILPKFNAFDYQMVNGGITLLPYSSDELELSARVAALNSDDFDKESLAQYFFKKLEDKNSNQEEISLSLFGLASLEKPVLPRINSWLERKDLSVDEKLYLAQALFDLGDKEKSRKLYYDIMNERAEKKDPHIIVRAGNSADEVFKSTALAAVLAASLNAPEHSGLWNYLISNQVLWGRNKNSEILFNLEKLNYIKHTLPNLKPSPANVVYELFEEKKEVKITGDNIHSFQLNPEHVNELKFLSIEGDVGISVRRAKPIDLSATAKDSDIGIKREYYVNGVKTNKFKESDVIEIRLSPSFGKSALQGSYQITDILPSGLMPVTKLYSWGKRFDCNYWYPYNTDGQTVKYKISRNWKNNYCGGNYIKYYARVKTRGEYKAEPAILQSFINPEYINYSQAEFITITE